MIRSIIKGLVLTLLLSIAGCGASGQHTAVNDDLFRTRNDEFARNRADHMKKSSEAVRDYQRYRNR
jgi:hypothetical protein